MIDESKKVFDKQKNIRDGIRIALIGTVNAGKSSLLNALLKNDRAIVTDIPGTTRDVIEVGLYKNNIYWTLIDTAGIRETNDIIEQQGIKKSFDEAKLADIVLLVVDQSRELSQEERLVISQLYSDFSNKIIVIANKVDLPKEESLFFLGKTIVEVSCPQESSITSLEKIIEQKVTALFKEIQSPFLVNKRQFTLLLALEESLKTITQMLKHHPVEFELVSAHINEALAHVSELTGKTISEKSLDAVFREFCVGK